MAFFDVYTELYSTDSFNLMLLLFVLGKFKTMSIFQAVGYHYFCTIARKHTNTFICQFFHKSVRRWWSPLSGVDLQNVLSRLPCKIKSQNFKEQVQYYTVSA